MFKIKYFVSSLLLTVLLAVPAAVVMFPSSVSATAVLSGDALRPGPAAQKALDATDDFKIAEADYAAAQVNVAEFKKLLAAATKLAATEKTDEAKSAVDKAKADLQQANVDLSEKKANVAKTKKVMDAAVKAAKPEIAAAAEAAALPGKIICVGKAVNERESSLFVMRGTYTDAVTVAYKIRANTISKLLETTTTAKEIKTGNKAIWLTFKDSMKAATKEWRASSASAWKYYKDAVKSCKASTDFTDSVNMSLEARGE